MHSYKQHEQKIEIAFYQIKCNVNAKPFKLLMFFIFSCNVDNTVPLRDKRTIKLVDHAE